MFKNLITSILKEILTFLIQHPTLLSEPEASRRDKMKDLKIPGNFIDTLAVISEEAFMKDLRNTLQFNEGGIETPINDNELLKALVKFFSEKMGFRMDVMSEGANFDYEAQQNLAKKLLPEETSLCAELRHLLTTYSYQELADAIIDLSKKTVGAPYILVQSPRTIDIELKKEIRKKLTTDNPLSFPVFQVNHNLIGGFRIFKEGENIDYSWISRVLRFTSLTSA